MDGLDLLDLILIKLIPKAHEHQQAKHRVVEMINQLNCSASTGVRVETIEQDMEDPLTGMGIGLDARRVEDFDSEVAVEETQSGAVGGSVNVVSIGGHDFTSKVRLRMVNKRDSILDECLVGKRTTEDEDVEARAKGEVTMGPYLVRSEGSEDGDGAGDRERMRGRERGDVDKVLTIGVFHGTREVHRVRTRKEMRRKKRGGGGEKGGAWKVEVGEGMVGLGLEGGIRFGEGV
ncbi:hypothetical protein Ancab_020644 [Ancistrocladus abbreviatus]